MMRILLVNDDGYNREGIRLLYKHLQKFGDVTLLAPLNHYSGTSASFTIDKPFTLAKYEEGIYSLDGSPVDCTLFGLCSGLFKPFDLVVSGCNDGLNLSYDIIYSGTIGACSEAMVHHIPAIAFSTDFGHFKIVEKYFDEVFQFILDNNLISKEYIINVNFPRHNFRKIKGIKLASLGMKEDTFTYANIDGKLMAVREENFEGAPRGTDVYLANKGYVSIVPIGPNAYHKDYLKALKSNMKKASNK